MAGISFVEVLDVGPGWNKVRASDGNVYTLKGDYNWRSFNPGNIEYGDFAKSMGAIGEGAVPPGRARGFAIFPDMATGTKAQQKLQFEGKGYRNKTIEQAIARYAPEFENDSAAYAAALAQALGVPVDTKLSDLTPAQRETYISAQQRIEGMKPGTIMGEEGKPVDASIARQFHAIPRPPTDVPSMSRAQSIGRSASPPPLPRPRPQVPEAEITRASFNPLPFPGRLKTPEAPNAAYSLMPPPIPSNASMPPRASRWKEEGGEWQTGQVLPPAVARPASLQQMPPQAPAPLPLLPFPALPRPGVGMGAVAGVGGMGAGAGGVVPPGPVPPRVPPAIPRLAATPPRYVPAAPPRERAAPPMPMGLPSFRRPVEAATPAPGGPPPIPSGGFDLGAMFAGLGEAIGAKAQEAGAALGNATTSTFEGAKNAVATTAGNATDLLKNELIGTVAGRTLLLNTLMGNKGTIQTNPGKYGATPEARREAAARRQALQEGRPYIAPGQQTAVRSSLSVRPPSFKPPQSRAERFTNLDAFGMIL